MKTKTLCSAVLLTLLGVSLVAPVAANAEAKSQLSNGKINFTQDDSQKDIDDPEDKDTLKPEEPVIVNPDRGAFSIDAVTNLDFGTDKIKAFGADPEYYAAAIVAKNSKDEDVTRGNFVQFTDVRGIANHKYTVSAQLTKQFEAVANTGTFLNGATIDFANASVTSKDPKAQWPVGTDTGTIAGFQLAPDALGTGAGDSKPVITNTDASKGIGTYTIEFGQYADGTAENNTSASSVMLTVPKTNVLLADDYAAEITWTIAEVL